MRNHQVGITDNGAFFFLISGELDHGETLKQLLIHLEPFFGNDIYAAMLVMGGVAMSFHFDLLYNTMGGVSRTVVIGASGKSTAVEAAMAIFNQRDSIGGKL
jgi:hypothetical protein